MKEGNVRPVTTDEIINLINTGTEEDRDTLYKLITAFFQLSHCEKITALRLIRLGGMYSSRHCRNKNKASLPTT